jgi:hypothetical protein
MRCHLRLHLLLSDEQVLTRLLTLLERITRYKINVCLILAAIDARAHDVADPPDLVAPVSPSAARTAATEKGRWKVKGETRASLVICVRSIIAAE